MSIPRSIKTKFGSFKSAVLVTAALALTISSFTMYMPHAYAFEESDSSYPAGGQGGQQDMHIVKTDRQGPNPAIIFVHGGGWRVDGGTFGPDFQRQAASRGYTSFRIQYKLMPNGIHEQLNEVMNAIKYIKDNADQYGIDPNRIAIWGDSAGGSLVVRAGATGKSGAAVTVGWSAPTNAYRDMFNSLPSFLDGLDHSECVDTSFTQQYLDLLTYFDGDMDTIQKIISQGYIPTPEEAISIANDAFTAFNENQDIFSNTLAGIQKNFNDFGINGNINWTKKDSSSSDSNSNSAPDTNKSDKTGNSDDSSKTTDLPKVEDLVKEPSNSSDSKNSDDSVFTRKDLQNNLVTMTPEEMATLGQLAYYLNMSSNAEDLTKEQRDTLFAMQRNMQEIRAAKIANDSKAEQAKSDLNAKVDDSTLQVKDSDVNDLAKASGLSKDNLQNIAKDAGVSVDRLINATNHYSGSLDYLSVAAADRDMSLGDFIKTYGPDYYTQMNDYDDISRFVKNHNLTTADLYDIAKENDLYITNLIDAIEQFGSLDHVEAAAKDAGVSLGKFVDGDRSVWTKHKEKIADSDKPKVSITKDGNISASIPLTINGQNTKVDVSVKGTDLGISTNIPVGGGDLAADINIQGDVLANKLAQCLQNFNDASPALNASPNSTPMYLANGTNDFLVPVADATEMVNKLRSMGIRAENLVIQDGNHMGYDPRAVDPSFNFLDSILHP